MSILVSQQNTDQVSLSEEEVQVLVDFFRSMLDLEKEYLNEDDNENKTNNNFRNTDNSSIVK